MRNACGFIGPGLIIASVTIGSGELVWASRSGAVFGCQMLWCVLLAISSTLATLERVSAVVPGLIPICAAIFVVACQPNLVDLNFGLLVPYLPDYEPRVEAEYAKRLAGRSPWLEVAPYLSAVGGGYLTPPVETARWDLIGKQQRQPLYEVCLYESELSSKNQKLCLLGSHP